MREFTVKEFAAVERVDERTVRRWILKGAVEYRKTPGGRIRIIDTSSRVIILTNPDNSGQSAA